MFAESRVGSKMQGAGREGNHNNKRRKKRVGLPSLWCAQSPRRRPGAARCPWSAPSRAPCRPSSPSPSRRAGGRLLTTGEMFGVVCVSSSWRSTRTFGRVGAEGTAGIRGRRELRGRRGQATVVMMAEGERTAGGRMEKVGGGFQLRGPPSPGAGVVWVCGCRIQAALP